MHYKKDRQRETIIVEVFTWLFIVLGMTYIFYMLIL